MVMLGQEGLEFGSMLGRQEVIRIRAYIKGVTRRRWLAAVRLYGRCCLYCLADLVIRRVKYWIDLTEVLVSLDVYRLFG